MNLEAGIHPPLNNMQSNLILNRLDKICTGAILGFAASMLIHVILFEHETFFILLPILPLLGITIGVVLCMSNKIPQLKLWILLFIFTVIVSTAFGISTIKSNILEVQRRKTSKSVALMHPGVHILDIKYSRGNGMEMPPHVIFRISNKDSYESVSKFYNEALESNHWNVRSPGRKWRKGNYVIYLSNYYNERDKKLESEDYRITVDFYGLWTSHFSNPLSKQP